MRTRTILFAVAANLIVGAASFAADAVTVSQKGLVFTPNHLTVTKGQVVDFINDDTTAHNVMITGDGVSFNGGLQPPGGHITYTFNKAGTFAVGCGIHPKMKLTVTVN
jgi:plastocyanin